MSDSITVIVPVFQGERWLRECLDAILRETVEREVRIVAIDDQGRDGSRTILEEYAADGRIELVQGAGLGAAAALNAGLALTDDPIVCQVDQDVILRPGWLESVLAELEPDVAAVQGYYETPRDGSIWSRVMGYDIESRYAALPVDTDHVCTGNVAYRAASLLAVGGFDETLGYGYDNDMSYRLVDAGWRLRFCSSARSLHRWREGVGSYLKQQYGLGYGRLDLIWKHRDRVGGDAVSDWRMILQVPVTAAAIGAAGLAGLVAAVGGSVAIPGLLAAGLGGLVLAERTLAGVRSAWRFRDAAALLTGPVHLLRNLAWVAATVIWGARRLARVPVEPGQSMGRDRGRVTRRG